MLILLKGWKMVVKICICLIQIVQEKILSLNGADEVMEYLKSGIWQDLTNSELIFNYLGKLKITNSFLQKLEA
jgi:hypothetical protein